MVEIKEACVSKNLDEAVRLQSEKRQESTQEITEERLQGIAEGMSSAPRLVSSFAESFPGRNECPGTHCSLIEQEEREGQFLLDLPEFVEKRKMEEKTGR